MFEYKGFPMQMSSIQISIFISITMLCNHLEYIIWCEKNKLYFMSSAHKENQTFDVWRKISFTGLLETMLGKSKKVMCNVNFNLTS